MMLLTDLPPETPYIENDAITQLMRVLEVKCQRCGAEETAMLEQLERKGWMKTKTTILCPKHRF